MQGFKNLAVAREHEFAAVGGVVRAARARHALEFEGVARNRHGFAHEHLHVAFRLIALDERDADDEDGHADVGDVHAPIGARLTKELRDDAAFSVADLLTEGFDGAEDDEEGERAAHEHPVAPFAHEKGNGGAENDRGDHGPEEGLRELLRIGFLPARERTHAHEEDEREHQGPEDGVEVRRPDRDLARVQGVEEERIERAEKHRAHRHDEENVVDEEHRFARDHPEVPAEAHGRGAPGKEKSEAKRS